MKHPDAIAWHDWITSDDGKSCNRPFDVLARQHPYLENRLWRAFHAGVMHGRSSKRKRTAKKGKASKA